MRHVIRRHLLNLIQKTPFEELIKDLVLRFSSGKGAIYDRETFEVMQQCLARDSNCIDVGAYRGDILRHLIKHAPDGEIYAIEPIPENCAYLKKKYPHVHLHHAALSDEMGKATFFHVQGRPARSGRQQPVPPVG